MHVEMLDGDAGDTDGGALVMSIDFLIGAIRASRDLHPQVKTELEEILHMVEPRVLTREEMKEGVEDHRPAFVEEWTEGAEPRCFWGLIERGFKPPEHGYNYPGGVDFNVVDTSQDMWDGDFYGMNSTLGWRAWTAEPSEEQRKAVPWT